MSRLIFVASLFMVFVSSVLATTASYLTLENAAAATRTDINTNGLLLQSWTWGATNSQTASSVTGGAGTGKVQFETLTIERKIDGNTPFLFTDVASGKRLSSITLTIVDANPAGPAGDFFPTVYTFSSVFVSSQTLSSDEKGAGIEKVSFVFAKASITFTAQNPNGSKGKISTGSWNIQTNQQNRVRSFNA